ncbi:MAG: tetraacyldisaccharide 4'-kinase [Sterolibacterium sp.]|nr:tetraacyldisaccharide 4'-kinase [Sterolibacterium sp.]
MRQALQRTWQKRGTLALLLLPLAGIFFLLATLRRWLYHSGLLTSHRLPVPVVVIGNITVGGSGKTPLCLWLALCLSQTGRSPGIVSRGHGGNLPRGQVREVLTDANALEVGDEPLLLKRRSGLPVFVGRNRVAAAKALLAAHPECDLILSDDGLQHYRLARDVEIAVLDSRGLMNGWLLPAGPLREPAGRLDSFDALVLNGKTKAPVTHVPTFQMNLAGTTFYALADPTLTCEAAALRNQHTAAVAGIGAPQRFFDHLAALGLDFSTYIFPDHHRYTAADLSAIAADALLMTEKDAVKCTGLSNRPIWVLPITAQVDPSALGIDLAAHVKNRIVEKPHGRPPA